MAKVNLVDIVDKKGKKKKPNVEVWRRLEREYIESASDCCRVKDQDFIHPAFVTQACLRYMRVDNRKQKFNAFKDGPARGLTENLLKVLAETAFHPNELEGCFAVSKLTEFFQTLELEDKDRIKGGKQINKKIT